LHINELYREDLYALNALFDKLNDAFFVSALTKPVVTLQHDRKGAPGWFKLEAWQAGEATSPELNISANFLDRKPLDKAATLLHEMCHLYAYQNNIEDTSRLDIYHNKRFKEIAEAHGLTVEKSEKHGYSLTALSPKVRAIIEPMLGGLQTLKRVEGKKAKSKQSGRKYVCPNACPVGRPQSFRASSEVNFLCGYCRCQVVEVKKLPLPSDEVHKLP